jgi:hypothetical protein
MTEKFDREKAKKYLANKGVDLGVFQKLTGLPMDEEITLVDFLSEISDALFPGDESAFQKLDDVFHLTTMGIIAKSRQEEPVFRLVQGESGPLVVWDTHTRPEWMELSAPIFRDMAQAMGGLPDVFS